MRGQPGVFAGKNAALIGHELFEQIDVLEIERVKSEINFWLGPGSARFGSAAFAASRFIFVCFAWHKKLFNFPVKSVTAKERIVFLDLKLFRLQFFVARRGVARRRFALFARLGTFNCDDFSCHKITLFL